MDTSTTPSQAARIARFNRLMNVRRAQVGAKAAATQRAAEALYRDLRAEGVPAEAFGSAQ